MQHDSKPSQAFLDNAASAFHGTPSESGADTVILKYINRIKSNDRGKPPTRSRCLIQDLGDFLESANKSLAELAAVLAECPEIKDYAEQRLKLLQRDNDASDFRDLTLVSNKHKILREITKAIDNSSHVVQHFCRQFVSDDYLNKAARQYSDDSEETLNYEKSNAYGPIPSFRTVVTLASEGRLPSEYQPAFPNIEHNATHDKAASLPFPRMIPEPLHMGVNGLMPVYSPLNRLPSMHPVPSAEHEPVPIHPSLPSHKQQQVEPMISPTYQIIEEDPGLIMIEKQLAALGSSRGTGVYTCGYGQSCKKGGVDKAGNLNRFTRNSAFKAHLEKHRRQYKCEMAGCPARHGFARIDQLRRHQENVPHDKT